MEQRLKNLQSDIGVPATGIFDAATLRQLEKLFNLLAPDTDFQGRLINLQKFLGFTGKLADGIFGILTLSRIEEKLAAKLPKLPAGASMIVSLASIRFLIKQEVSSSAAYERLYAHPLWPGGESGVTIGIGYDLGYATLERFATDWKSVLPAATYKYLSALLGKTGTSAKASLTAKTKDIRIPYKDAEAVFLNHSLPRYAKKCVQIWPGVHLLPADAQGALLSLVYNRGWSLDGDNRREMRSIALHVANQNLRAIAREIRSMKRLWEGNPALRGLARRREEEALLVEDAHYYLPKKEIFFI